MSLNAYSFTMRNLGCGPSEGTKLFPSNCLVGVIMRYTNR